MQPHYHFSRLGRLQEQPRGSRQDVHTSAGREEGQEGLDWEERVGHHGVGPAENREQQEVLGAGLEEEGVKLAPNSEMKSPDAPVRRQLGCPLISSQSRELRFPACLCLAHMLPLLLKVITPRMVCWKRCCLFLGDTIAFLILKKENTQEHIKGI